MYMRAQHKSLPAALELLASKPSLGDLWLPSSLELVNCLSLFLLSMLQQKPQARSAHLQATENDFCVTPCHYELNKAHKRAEGQSGVVEVRRLSSKQRADNCYQGTTQHLPVWVHYSCWPSPSSPYYSSCSLSGKPLRPLSFPGIIWEQTLQHHCPCTRTQLFSLISISSFYDLTLTLPHLHSEALEKERGIRKKKKKKEKARKWNDSAVSGKHRSISQRW